LPNDLSYKGALLKAKIHKKQGGVAPGPEITRHRDTFHQFDLDPRHFTNNPAVLSHFLTEMGKIKSRDQTGLTLKSQRLIGRTIRRSKMMGIIPTLSKGYKRYF
jgi:small subunit ribosomal protein S18